MTLPINACSSSSPVTKPISPKRLFLRTEFILHIFGESTDPQETNVHSGGFALQEMLRPRLRAALHAVITPSSDRVVSSWVTDGSSSSVFPLTSELFAQQHNQTPSAAEKPPERRRRLEMSVSGLLYD